MLEGFWPQGGQEDGPVKWGKFSQFDVDVMSPSMDSEDDVLAADNPDALLSTFISSYTISDGSESGAMDVDGRNPEFVRPPSFLVCSQLRRFFRHIAPRIASSISHRWEGGGIERVLYLELFFPLLRHGPMSLIVSGKKSTRFARTSVVNVTERISGQWA